MSEWQFEAYLASAFIGIMLGFILAPLAVTLGYALSDAVSGRISAYIKRRARMEFEAKMRVDAAEAAIMDAATREYYDEMMGGRYRTNVGRTPYA